MSMDIVVRIRIKKIPLALVSLFLMYLLFSACSSAPEKPAEIFALRNGAASQLDMANRMANQGKYQDALIVLEEARRLAISADDPALRIKTAISRGNICFSTSRHDEAFADWESAAAEGEEAGEKELAGLARIYIARGRLVLPEKREGLTAADIGDQVRQEIALIKNDTLATAVGWMVAGMADKELGRYPEAESAVRRALVIHEEGRFLEEAAYDWYLIASIRSVAGQYDAALEALGTAVAFDRRAENGFGLASSWLAMGDIYLKAAQTEKAAAAFRRAAAIYRSIGLESAAAAAEKRLE